MCRRPRAARTKHELAGAADEDHPARDRDDVAGLHVRSERLGVVRLDDLLERVGAVDDDGIGLLTAVDAAAGACPDARASARGGRPLGQGCWSRRSRGSILSVARGDADFPVGPTSRAKIWRQINRFGRPLSSDAFMSSSAGWGLDLDRVAVLVQRRWSPWPSARTLRPSARASRTASAEIDLLHPSSASKSVRRQRASRLAARTAASLQRDCRSSADQTCVLVGAGRTPRHEQLVAQITESRSACRRTPPSAISGRERPSTISVVRHGTASGSIIVEPESRPRSRDRPARRASVTATAATTDVALESNGRHFSTRVSNVAAGAIQQRGFEIADRSASHRELADPRAADCTETASASARHSSLANERHSASCASD